MLTRSGRVTYLSPGDQRQVAKGTRAILLFISSHKFFGISLIHDVTGWGDL